MVSKFLSLRSGGQTQCSSGKHLRGMSHRPTPQQQRTSAATRTHHVAISLRSSGAILCCFNVAAELTSPDVVIVIRHFLPKGVFRGEEGQGAMAYAHAAVRNSISILEHSLNSQ